jgi:DNA-directed RNA polymerase III subunit RPC3
MEDASNANDSPRSSISGAKRKHNALEGDAELDSTIAENEVLWRANFEKFTFCLKKKFCADRKKPKLKVGTHPIWEAFFEASLMERDNNSGNSHISISSNLSILEPENTSILCYGCSLSFICLNIIIFVC